MRSWLNTSGTFALLTAERSARGLPIGGFWPAMEVRVKVKIQVIIESDDGHIQDVEEVPV